MRQSERVLFDEGVTRVVLRAAWVLMTTSAPVEAHGSVCALSCPKAAALRCTARWSSPSATAHGAIRSSHLERGSRQIAKRPNNVVRPFMSRSWPFMSRSSVVVG